VKRPERLKKAALKRREATGKAAASAAGQLLANLRRVPNSYVLWAVPVNVSKRLIEGSGWSQVGKVELAKKAMASALTQREK
jgi:hypothetical protein